MKIDLSETVYGELKQTDETISNGNNDRNM